MFALVSYFWSIHIQKWQLIRSHFPSIIWILWIIHRFSLKMLKSIELIHSWKRMAFLSHSCEILLPKCATNLFITFAFDRRSCIGYCKTTKTVTLLLCSVVIHRSLLFFVRSSCIMYDILVFNLTKGRKNLQIAWSSRTCPNVGQNVTLLELTQPI